MNNHCYHYHLTLNKIHLVIEKRQAIFILVWDVCVCRVDLFNDSAVYRIPRNKY